VIELAVVNNKIPKFIIRLAVHCGIIFFLSLAGMRFYASYLEQEVAAISRVIEQLSMEEMSLNQQLSALKSPNIIYSYCKDTLKMQRSTSVGVIKMIKIK
jgi:cell division protein FtsB